MPPHVFFRDVPLAVSSRRVKYESSSSSSTSNLSPPKKRFADLKRQTSLPSTTHNKNSKASAPVDMPMPSMRRTRVTSVGSRNSDDDGGVGGYDDGASSGDDAFPTRTRQSAPIRLSSSPLSSTDDGMKPESLRQLVNKNAVKQQQQQQQAQDLQRSNSIATCTDNNNMYNGSRFSSLRRNGSLCMLSAERDGQEIRRCTSGDGIVGMGGGTKTSSSSSQPAQRLKGQELLALVNATVQMLEEKLALMPESDSKARLRKQLQGLLTPAMTSSTDTIIKTDKNRAPLRAEEMLVTEAKKQHSNNSPLSSPAVKVSCDKMEGEQQQQKEEEEADEVSQQQLEDKQIVTAAMELKQPGAPAVGGGSGGGSGKLVVLPPPPQLVDVRQQYFTACTQVDEYSCSSTPGIASY